MFIELGEDGGEREGYGNEGREQTPSTGLQHPSSKLMEEGCRKARLGVRGGNCERKGCGRDWTAGKDPDPVRGMRRMVGDMQILITMKVFIKRKMLSVETVLSAYTHTNTHTHTQAPLHASILIIQSLIYTHVTARDAHSALGCHTMRFDCRGQSPGHPANRRASLAVERWHGGHGGRGLLEQRPARR